MIQGALKNPYLVVVVALAAVVLGVTSYQKIPADLLPIFKTPAVQIVTFYPGMPPEVMAGGRLESATVSEKVREPLMRRGVWFVLFNFAKGR